MLMVRSDLSVTRLNPAATRFAISRKPKPQQFHYIVPHSLDSLVLHLQLLHDGHLPGWLGLDDPHEDAEEGLRQVLEGGRHR